MCFQVEKLIKEHADKLKDSDKGPLEAAIKKAREAAKGENVDAIKSAISELEQASHALSARCSTKRSRQAVPPAAARSPVGASDGKSPGDDEVVDAEFEVKE